MKKYSVIFALLLALALCATACGSEPAQTSAAPTAPATTVAPAEKTTAAPETAAPDTQAPATDAPAPESTEAPAASSLEDPVLVVSVGMSADLSIAKSIMGRIKADYRIYDKENGDTFDLTGIKTVMLVPGVSTKGLGEAGILLDDELAATRDILEKINAADVKVLVAHLGGSSRRDDLTDQFINLVLPEADFIVALEEANRDGIFTAFATANNVPCDVCANLSALVTAVQNLFGK